MRSACCLVYGGMGWWLCDACLDMRACRTSVGKQHGKKHTKQNGGVEEGLDVWVISAMVAPFFRVLFLPLTAVDGILIF